LKKPIVVLGKPSKTGTYILRIHVRQKLKISFGRFRKGQIISIPKGDYLYIGSAMGKRGSMTLPARLLRHGTRAAPHPPHKIRKVMLDQFQSIGIRSGNLHPPKDKKLYWNIDYLLNNLHSEIAQTIIVCSSEKLEGTLGKYLEDDPVTGVIEKGLEANDLPGNTHLLRLLTDKTGWNILYINLRNFLEELSI
jgi:Uri superfamily endonuclease